MLIWVFTSSKEAKNWLDKKRIVPKIWDRMIALWDEQTSYERNWKMRLNINWIYIIWEKWEDGMHWKNWKNADPVDEDLLFNRLYEKIRLDWSFHEKIRWKQWEPWKPWKDWLNAVPNVSEVIEPLINKLVDNKDFLEKVKAKDWTDWKNGIDWKPWTDWNNGIDWKPWTDWIDWEWSYIHIVTAEINKRERLPKDICIDPERNIYYFENNTIKKMPFKI